mmetsp:Transcript_3528/g.7146  ORF Transcript_3528/g.7146 Transcript_3528/m.7146 type:complete len:271 (-) Transcript_3528:1975-2787(-)
MALSPTMPSCSPSTILKLRLVPLRVPSFFICQPPFPTSISNEGSRIFFFTARFMKLAPPLKSLEKFVRNGLAPLPSSSLIPTTLESSPPFLAPLDAMQALCKFIIFSLALNWIPSLTMRTSKRMLPSLISSTTTEFLSTSSLSATSSSICRFISWYLSASNSPGTTRVALASVSVPNSTGLEVSLISASKEAPGARLVADQSTFLLLLNVVSKESVELLLGVMGGALFPWPRRVAIGFILSPESDCSWILPLLGLLPLEGEPGMTFWDIS